MVWPFLTWDWIFETAAIDKGAVAGIEIAHNDLGAIHQNFAMVHRNGVVANDQGVVLAAPDGGALTTRLVYLFFKILIGEHSFGMD